MIAAFVPIILAPLLAVEFSKVIVYLPIATMAALIVLVVRKQSWPVLMDAIKKMKVFWGIAGALIIGILAHTYMFAEFDQANERAIKITATLLIGGMFLTILNAQNTVDRGALQKILKLLLISSSIGALLVIAEITTGLSIYKHIRNMNVDHAPSTAVFNPGSLSIIFMGLSSFFLLDKKKGKIELLCLAIIIAMLFVIQSQSAQLAFICAVILYVIVRFSLQHKAVYPIVFFMVASMLLAKPFIAPAIYHNMPEFLTNISFFKNGFAPQRLEIWEYISQKIYDKPLLGHGLEFTKYYQNFVSVDLYNAGNRVLHPHSFILQIWIEFGLLGILAAIGLIGAIFKIIACKLSKHEQYSAMSIFLTTLLISSLSHGMWQGWWLGLLYMIAGLHILSRNSIMQTQKGL